MNIFKRLLGGAPPANSESQFLTYYVRGFKCGALTRLRINKANDLSRTDNDEGFFVRKVIVDDRCYGQVEVEITFDPNYHKVDRVIRGGEFISEAQFCATTNQTLA
jgi:hypothetical protein